ncbi:hypothetical protein ACHAPT_001018 [Fusarium lateritium]
MDRFGARRPDPISPWRGKLAVSGTHRYDGRQYSCEEWLLRNDEGGSSDGGDGGGGGGGRWWTVQFAESAA